MKCPHCDKPVFTPSAGGTKLKARTRIVVMHKSTGDVEINCSHCGHGVLLPLAPAGDPVLRKARGPRLVARKA